ncbi:inositol monophosphatase [Roseomonas sp. AR75]|jgi:myo-inositol-1(or 4)-monophosphatase|uniref:inositol monophosphatase family protein n=1 Tax=Roseomonas sp. AR75 TaxID=2562311 RepID=UPI0010C1541F|nr:inositol monophosphatase [Roseomonas sp. AR75]
MTPAELARRLDAIAPVAQQAADLAARMRANGMAETTMKGAQDFLTEADGATEHFIRQQLERLFPGEPVLGEEGGGTVPKDGPLWILDPIDGTANFARDAHRWCVSIGMALDGRAMLGAIARHAPAELILGAEGCGATLNGAPIRAAATSDIGRAIVEVGWSLRRPAAAFVALVGRVMASGAGVRSSGSGTLGLVDAAIGRQDAYIELHINAWDACGALAIAREAGCWTNDFDSGEWLQAGNPICFAAPALGPRLAALMQD